MKSLVYQTATMAPSLQTDPIFSQLRNQIDQLLLLLSQKEKFVIQRRFNLDEKSRATLEEIGRHFQVTRERVRQIEKNALQKLKRNIENTPLNTVNKMAFQILQENGGLLREDLLLSKLLNGQTGFAYAALQLIINLDKRFERIPNTVQYHPYAKFKTLPEQFIRDIAIKSLNILEKNGEVMKISSIVSELKKTIQEDHLLQKETLASICEINKHFKVIDDGVGLIKWRNINPRTIRDKVFYILRDKHKPLHFVDIANEIFKAQFDKKNLNQQAIHNELIRNNEFILVGRGIYALKEWGFNAGTVAEIIESILKNKGSMHQDDIVTEVLKQRQVKPITIILNLKSKGNFIRVGRYQYSLKT